MQQTGFTAQSAPGLPDVLVIGAGIMGLWAARNAIRAGKRVTVVDSGEAGGGASGGFVGALMPHMPDRWDAKSQLQFEGLIAIEEAIADLEEDTGLDCGFRRCGRVIPIVHPNTLEQIRGRIEGANRHWRGFSLQLLQPPYRQTPAEWLDEGAAQFGAQLDTLSARVDPRRYVGALARYVRSTATLIEGAQVIEIDARSPSVRLADGTVLAAGAIVVAAGWRAYRLLQPFMGQLATAGRLGQGVKGQAVLMRFAHDDDRPILFDDGNYVVPHTGNRIAIGSTSRTEWQTGKFAAPGAFDPGDTSFLARALELAPVLRNGEIVERWAGVRPRNRLKGRGTEPYCGKVPGYENLTALIGGFKIGFAIAHLVSLETVEADLV
jgi:glycine/D-amino acid oxidase-like deaminating enzyme